MPTYSEVIRDKEILKLLEGKHSSVLLLGCSSCMNESIAYKNDLPVFAKDDAGDIVAYSMLSELKRLTCFLNKSGFNARYQFLPEGSNSGCMLNYGETLYEISLIPRPDILLVLGCPSYVHGIEAVSNEIPVLSITKQLGYLAYGYEVDEDGTRRIIKERSKVIRY